MAKSNLENFLNPTITTTPTTSSNNRLELINNNQLISLQLPLHTRNPYLRYRFVHVFFCTLYKNKKIYI